MAGTLDFYGYKDEEIGLVSTAQQMQKEQNEKDAEQDVKIKENYDVNVIQQTEINTVVGPDGGINIDLGYW